ncbi:aspartyl-phosphate phosphatase Spo0E family protein [Aneurinibacillus terranovensis]|uniref:aspartyl-phosphate phosphatase Spo0E family protein n=1 Tax=Aneurinibacillus terranovensis TaxID=278991 RepID=UPI0004166DDD|nr:aspartyl-phosphate phosphatase Spo0E family protein [Aneurinibacillus terranovensis]
MEENKLIQLIIEKRTSMHQIYKQSNRNLLDKKVLKISQEIDCLVNEIMKQRLSV